MLEKSVAQPGLGFVRPQALDMATIVIPTRGLHSWAAHGGGICFSPVPAYSHSCLSPQT